MREGGTLGVTSVKSSQNLAISQGHWAVLCLRARRGVSDHSGGRGGMILKQVTSGSEDASEALVITCIFAHSRVPVSSLCCWEWVELEGALRLGDPPPAVLSLQRGSPFSSLG